MLGRDKISPAEREKLLARCEEIGLNEKEVSLLCDLLAWNFDFDKKDETLPESYLGIEPHLTARAAEECTAQGKIPVLEGMPNSQDVFTWNAIQNLIARLFGQKLMFSVCTEPIKVLEGQLKLKRQQVVWLAIQLHLSEVCPELIFEFVALGQIPLHEMANKVVMPTLLKLLFEVAQKA